MSALTPYGDPALPDSSALFQQIFAASMRHRLALGEDGEPSISYATEADLRSGLGRLAWAYGWDVREEVVIPGWGRIDLVLSDESPGAYLIELKVELAKPAQVRRGFQQADGYGRWWKNNRQEPARSFLSAAKVSVAADCIATAAEAYPEVGFLSTGSVMDRMAKAWGDPASRVAVAERRRQAVKRLLAVQDHAVAEIGGLS